MCLLGQANVVFHRQLNIMAKVMKNQKKYQKFLAKNAKHLVSKKLFGKRLTKVSQDHKKLRCHKIIRNID